MYYMLSFQKETLNLVTREGFPPFNLNPESCMVFGCSLLLTWKQRLVWSNICGKLPAPTRLRQQSTTSNNLTDGEVTQVSLHSLPETEVEQLGPIEDHVPLQTGGARGHVPIRVCSSMGRSSIGPG